MTNKPQTKILNNVDISAAKIAVNPKTNRNNLAANFQSTPKTPNKNVTNNDIMNKFVNKFRKDGVDHIRISTWADSRIGKALAPEYLKKFFIPQYGEFLSPQCFANWLITGNDEARHDINIRGVGKVKGYSDLVMFAKFFQLCSLERTLAEEYKDLPFVMYKIHLSGVREYHRWKQYPSQVKDMLLHILDPNKGTKNPYPWDDKYPGLVSMIKEQIESILQEQNGSDDKPVPDAIKESQANAETNLSSVIKSSSVKKNKKA